MVGGGSKNGHLNRRSYYERPFFDDFFARHSQVFLRPESSGTHMKMMYAMVKLMKIGHFWPFFDDF